MINIAISEKELKGIYELAKKRHNAKDDSFRNTGILIPDPKSVYAPHTIGLLGEYAWGKHTRQEVDAKIYKVRDDGQDFHNTEVKTLTYFGSGEPELKIKKKEFASKTPRLYVLARVDKKDLTNVELLGTISRVDFEQNKTEKRYGHNNPLNYVVTLSQMNQINTPNFLSKFQDYGQCMPPGVLLPQIEIEKKYYSRLGVDEGVSNLEFLTELCRQGSKEKKVHEFSNKESYYSRVKMELAVLNDLGFIDYVLLNWDILNYCHENNIPTGPGRGSAAGSLVLFLIGVTHVDPVKHELFFERFVSKSRARKVEFEGKTYLDGSLLADIDNDIAYQHRQSVIKYIEAKHPGRTAKILTLNTLSSKLCIKECGKIVGGKEESEVNLVSDSIPKHFGEVAKLAAAYAQSEKFTTWADENRSSYDIALKLEGLNKNTGVHPSGIAISHQEIETICPLQLTGDGAYVTGYDMNWVSELMVKFDILGLRTLSVIYDVCEALDLDVYDIPLDDSAVFMPLQELSSPHGLFQLEADTNYKVCKKIKPRSLEELSAVVALARPGALDFVESYSSYITTGDFQSVHSFFDDVLSYTGGIPLYQEQLMQMAVKVGFSLDEAEQIRRIVGKKKVEKMASWKKRIEKQVEKEHLPSEVADILWKVAEDSANYSFNKSHALSYSTLAAWTVYLKFKYPLQFFLSLLKMTKFEPSPHEEITKISQELPGFKIELLSPDLAKSSMDFSLEGKDIRFGLNSIKGVSSKSLEALGDFRESDTPNKFDIFIAAKQAGLNIGILSALIQAGSLSDYKSNRSLVALEAQAFNILTDREKRNVVELGEKYDYKLLNILADARDGKLVGDDGRPLMPPKRFETFRKKYTPYKEIYEKNKKYEKFANWYFETKLLGYSYTTKLREVFASDPLLIDSQSAERVSQNTEIKFIGTVEDAFKGTSRNGNQYIKLSIGDEIGTIDGLFMNSRRPSRGGRWVLNNRLDKYLDAGGTLPEKGNIVLVRCTRGDDVFFIEEIHVLDRKIYMKLSDLR